MQRVHNSIANGLELQYFCTNDIRSQTNSANGSALLYRLDFASVVVHGWVTWLKIGLRFGSRYFRMCTPHDLGRWISWLVIPKHGNGNRSCRHETSTKKQNCYFSNLIWTILNSKLYIICIHVLRFKLGCRILRLFSLVSDHFTWFQVFCQSMAKYHKSCKILVNSCNLRLFWSWLH